MNEKIQRHEKAEQFRQEISSVGSRMADIAQLISKRAYDETDNMRIRELFRKTDYALGCESEYKRLIAHLYQFPELQPKAREFYKRWTAK